MSKRGGVWLRETNVLLDEEALRHIKETSPPDNVQSWIELLSGKRRGEEREGKERGNARN